MPANAMRGEAALGDFTLVFTFNALCLLEQETGMKVPALLELMQEGLGLNDLRSFVWAGLQEKHEGMTLSEAGDLIGAFGVRPPLSAVASAVEACLAPAKEEKAGNPPKAA